MVATRISRDESGATRSQDQWAHVPDELRIRYDQEFVSIPNAARIAAGRYPDDEALVDGDLRLTFAELETAMLDSVRAMIALGIRPGMRVGLWAPNSARWVLAALGVHGAGGILVPINTRFKGEEAAFVLNRSAAAALVAVTDFLDNDYLGMIRAAAPDTEALQRAVVASGDTTGSALSWDEFIAAGQSVSLEEAHAAIDAVTPETLSDLMFTSGTTGQPKGVMLTHAQSLRAHGWLSKVLGFRPGDRYLIIPPFFHTFGYKAGWMACILHGVTAIPQRVLDVGNVLRTIAAENVSILMGPPTLFSDILDAPDRGDHDLSSLRVTLASAASVPPMLVRRMIDELQADVTMSAYGLTEATSLATTTIPGVDQIADVVDSVGRAVLDVELRVVDEAAADVPDGASGELWVRGYNVMRGYWDDPEQTAEAITPDGWLRTGDIVIRDERGFVRIVDRKKDLVVVGGFNVYPAEVERILSAHPSVADIALVGVPDARLGEAPVAFVVPHAGETLSDRDFLAWAADRLANFKVPRRVIFIDALPRNASMKVLKNQLRDVARPSG
jgi:acyl-CoA synthetase (AMP-forming)/AMP-acid ligase II